MPNRPNYSLDIFHHLLPSSADSGSCDQETVIVLLVVSTETVFQLEKDIKQPGIPFLTRYLLMFYLCLLTTCCFIRKSLVIPGMEFPMQFANFSTYNDSNNMHMTGFI